MKVETVQVQSAIVVCEGCEAVVPPHLMCLWNMKPLQI